MSEEEQVVDPVDVEQTVDVTPEQQRAMDSGWVPKEDWDGDPDLWVDYKEFNYRGELFDRIKRESSTTRQLAKELDDVKQALKTLGEHNKRLAKTEYEKSMKTLKAQKKEALANEDFDTVLEIDDDIDELKTRQAEASKVEEEPSKAKEPSYVPTDADKALMANWERSNSSWYGSNKTMTAAATGLGQAYLSENPTAPVKEVLEYIDKEIREAFPHKFRGKKGPQAVADTDTSATTTTQTKRKVSVTKLSEEQKKVGNTFVKQGVFKSLQEYANQLAEIGELV